MQLAFLNNNKYSAINAMKAILAVSIALTVGNYTGFLFGIQEMYVWMVITVLVVMSTQPNLGGAIDKALMRFVGTVVGAVISILLILIFDKDLQIVLVMPFLALAVYVAGSSSRFSYAGTLSAITLTIIIFNEHPSLHLALYRGAEISIGISIALIVNRFFFPIRAGTRLKQSYSKSIYQIRDFFSILFVERNSEHVKLQESLFYEFSKHLSLLKELKYEQSSKNVKEYDKMGLYIRRLYRYMIVMYEYMEVSVSQNAVPVEEDNEVFEIFKKHVVESLTYIATDMKDGKRISYQKISCFKKTILPLVNSLGSSSINNDTFIFYTKMFFLSLEKLAHEYNYILSLSKD
jgi:uncharacterized membrane protein YgaE (UPF0421/DUF939 family)